MAELGCRPTLNSGKARRYSEEERTPAGVVLRGALELVACAVAFSVDQRAWEKYSRGGFHTPGAVSIAERELPFFGRWYGVLSNDFVHERLQSLDRVILDRGGRTPLPARILGILGNVGLVPTIPAERCFQHRLQHA
jgi:hypothetical protein